MGIVSEMKKKIAERGGTVPDIQGISEAFKSYDTAIGEGGGGSALPEVTSADNGDVLTVVEGEWAKAAPSCGDVFIVHKVYDEIIDNARLDKTWTEIDDALASGKAVTVLEYEKDAEENLSYGHSSPVLDVYTEDGIYVVRYFYFVYNPDLNVPTSIITHEYQTDSANNYPVYYAEGGSISTGILHVYFSYEDDQLCASSTAEEIHNALLYCPVDGFMTVFNEAVYTLTYSTSSIAKFAHVDYRCDPNYPSDFVADVDVVIIDDANGVERRTATWELAAGG